jgi:hypothetical protein
MISGSCEQYIRGYTPALNRVLHFPKATAAIQAATDEENLPVEMQTGTPTTEILG